MSTYLTSVTELPQFNRRQQCPWLTIPVQRKSLSPQLGEGGGQSHSDARMYSIICACKMENFEPVKASLPQDCKPFTV